MSKEGAGYELYIQTLHGSAAEGDVDGISTALKAIADVDVRNDRGWTALMFAARNGHLAAANTLISHGCDVSLINSIGQTARDIADFWQHHELARLLSDTATSGARASSSGQTSNVGVRNFFCNSPLDRASQRRTDAAWLADLRTKPTTVFVLFTTGLQPLGSRADKLLCSVARFRFSDELEKVLDAEGVTTVFLGVEHESGGIEGSSQDALSKAKDVGWFAVNATSVPDDTLARLDPDATKLSVPLGLMQLSRSEAAIVGQARAMLAWHERYGFCPTCGSATLAMDGGYKRQCVKDDCTSNNGVHNTCYPRTDPVVIMAVLSPEQDRILLGRAKRYPPGRWSCLAGFMEPGVHNTCYPRTDPTVIMAVVSPDKLHVLLGRAKRFPHQMWSCLAGFLEPGESIEEACRREVCEEAGIKVGRVDYHSCQPWPMPSSLMIGCIAYAESMIIKVDKEELEDARWFSGQDLRQMLIGQHPDGFFCPPEQAIAHQLLKHCATNMSKL